MMCCYLKKIFPLALALGLSSFAMGEPLAGPETVDHYDDLLTGGANLLGTEPVAVDPENPTYTELRRLALYSNIRALIDVTDGGGYGRLYGPKGPVGGHEYLMMGRLDGLNHPVTYMVQVPDNFDAANPCLITAPASGGRTVYGAVGVIGSWALPKGCAVAYTDKATGIGIQYLSEDRVYDARGKLVNGGEDVPFRLDMTQKLKNYIAKNPGHMALKHAHSRDNSQKNWGRTVLKSIEVAFYILNKYHNPTEKPFDKKSVLVIASSISNGGYASLRAAEQDSEGLIDAVVVSEPNLSPDMESVKPFSIQYGTRLLEKPGRQFLDYANVMNKLLPCAFFLEPVTAPMKMLIPYGNKGLENRCRTLAEKGLVAGKGTQEQAQDARRQLQEYGFLDQARMADGFSLFAEIWPAVVIDYTLAYGRYGVEDQLCGYGLSNISPLTEQQKQAMFAKSSGMIPSNGLYWIKGGGAGFARS